MPPTTTPSTSMKKYHRDPTRTALLSATPRETRTDVRLYCMLNAASDSACAGSTIVKYSRLVAGPTARSEIAARAANDRPRTMRVGGAQIPSATQAGRPRCGSIIEAAAATAASRQRPLQAKYADTRIAAMATGTIWPRGIDVAARESAEAASTVFQEQPANWTTVPMHVAQARSSSISQAIAAAVNGSSDRGTNAAR